MKAKGREHVLTEAIRTWQGIAQSGPFLKRLSLEHDFFLNFAYFFSFGLIRTDASSWEESGLGRGEDSSELGSGSGPLTTKTQPGELV